MSELTYIINPLRGLFTHGQHAPVVLDAASDMHKRELDVHVRSGDYFSTLATTLDALREELSDANKGEQGQLDEIVADLLYLQQNYQVVKKK